MIVEPLLTGDSPLTNAVIFSYGESHSGKTTTLFGSNWEEQISILENMLKQEFLRSPTS